MSDIDHSRMKTGYDIEILPGADYILAFIYSGFDSGEIPSELCHSKESLAAI